MTPSAAVVTRTGSKVGSSDLPISSTSPSATIGAIASNALSQVNLNQQQTAVVHGLIGTAYALGKSEGIAEQAGRNASEVLQLAAQERQQTQALVRDLTVRVETFSDRIERLEANRSRVDQQIGSIEKLLENTVVGQVMALSVRFSRAVVELARNQADTRILMIALSFVLMLHKTAARGSFSRYSIAPAAIVSIPITITLIFLRVIQLRDSSFEEVKEKMNQVREEKFTWIALACLTAASMSYSSFKWHHLLPNISLRKS